MKKFTLIAGLILASVFLVPLWSQDRSSADMARWQQQAKNITIIRDDWGIAHVYGKTDADAVFGAMYAQCEDDFNRVETNLMQTLGRVSESDGESKIWQDLRMRLYTDPDGLKKDYDSSPDWLKPLMNAWADGMNFYLATHPQVHPHVLTHFEPWMALSLTEGSVPLGGDIDKVNLGLLQAFYGKPADAPVALADEGPEQGLPDSRDAEFPVDPGGSNGIAVSANNTVDHHSLLLINPHTSFYFRSELQMVSDQGLDAYGASTWGQFFIYQGFNDHVGWMHTSSGVNATTNYLETVTKQGNGYVYKYGTEERPVKERTVTIRYKADNGSVADRTFTVYSTQHGPVVAEINGKWETFDMMYEPVKALEQSFGRTKAKNYKEYSQQMELHANSSNNTIFADSDGDIAYWHANYIPRRDPKFDWTHPVDGSDPATDWKGLLSVDESPRLFNPASGWIYNSNNWPWSAAGPSSQKASDFPVYVDNGRQESPRGYHAIRVLSDRKDFTLNGLLAAAFDSYQPGFEKPIPALVKAWDSLPADNPNKVKTTEQIALLRNWDLRWGADSVATSLAVYWIQDAQRRVSGGGRRGGGGGGGGGGRGNALEDAPAEELVVSLVAASDRLTGDFGTWKTPWGQINRFQRVNDDINQTFDDNAPSIPVEFTSATWGSLASFAARTYPGTKRMYGSSGNSFVAVVEFGPKVRARAVTAGGESGLAGSKHFNDEAERYANGNLRDVYYYRDQLKGHTEREYHPGS